MTTIYILELKECKFYVGKTKNLFKRLEDHKSEKGSEWTKLYSPIKLLQSYENCDDFDEDKFTLKLMSEKGIDNVRGGSFVTVNLSEETINSINKMINGSENRCFDCGKEGHFAKDCTEDNLLCSRCGRNNHNVLKCYASTNLNGDKLTKKKDTYVTIPLEKKLNAEEKKFSQEERCIYCKRILITRAVLIIHESQCSLKNSNQPCPNTVDGSLLDKSRLLLFSQKLDQSHTKEILELEVIKLLYSYDDQHRYYYTNILVGITNYRIFKMEEDDVSFVYIKDILSVRHEKNGLFKWDKLEITMKDNSIQTFGIYHSKTCEYFCQYINIQIK